MFDRKRGKAEEPAADVAALRRAVAATKAKLANALTTREGARAAHAAAQERHAQVRNEADQTIARQDVWRLQQESARAEIVVREATAAHTAANATLVTCLERSYFREARALAAELDRALEAASVANERLREFCAASNAELIPLHAEAGVRGISLSVRGLPIRIVWKEFDRGPNRDSSRFSKWRALVAALLGVGGAEAA